MRGRMVGPPRTCTRTRTRARARTGASPSFGAVAGHDNGDGHAEYAAK